MTDDFFQDNAARQPRNSNRHSGRAVRMAILAAATALLGNGFFSSGALAQANTAPGTTSTSMQPSSVRANYGAWSIVCDQPPGASAEQCVLMQNVVAADREEFGLSVVVLKTADKKAQILRVLAPLGVLLPNGLGLNIDGTDIGRAYFVRCFTDGCYAEVILEESLIKALEEGKSATFYVFQTPEEGIGIPVDLTGFTDGYKALP